jgi:hypothetical protein
MANANVLPQSNSVDEQRRRCESCIEPVHNVRVLGQRRPEKIRTVQVGKQSSVTTMLPNYQALSAVGQTLSIEITGSDREKKDKIHHHLQIDAKLPNTEAKAKCSRTYNPRGEQQHGQHEIVPNCQVLVVRQST